MTYYDNPNTEFVAVQVQRQNEDGRHILGAIATVPVENGDIEHGQIETFHGDTRYTAQPTPQLYERLRGMGLTDLGYRNYKFMVQDEVDRYVMQCEAQMQFMNDEMNRLRTK
jgi:hypothetical protein